MSKNWCHYDCSQHPETLNPNADISGIGVSLALTISSGLTVAVVLIYYFIAYRPGVPNLRPLATTRGPVAFSANSIDICLLCPVEGRLSGTPNIQLTRRQRALAKAMLVMADVQLFNGLSIMISGYSQLRCGLSAYHWEKIIYLAWFSAITDLSCLTFLRSFLYHHKAGRLWRILGISILVIMLNVGLIPTGHFMFRYTCAYSAQSPRFRPALSDYAICYLNHYDNPFSDDRNASADVSGCRESLRGTFRATQQYMVISVLFLGLGLTQRLLRLYEVPSTLLSRSKRATYATCIGLLRKTYDHDNKSTLSYALRRGMVYRPLLALYLTFRIFMDFWSSLAFEVWLLFLGFFWGTVRLWYILSSDVKESQVQEWTFGQVMPLVLLAAPVFTMLDGYFAGSEEEPKSQSAQDFDSVETSRDLAGSMSSIEGVTDAEGPADHPDRDYFTAPWMRSLAICFFLNIMLLSGLLILALILYVEPLYWLSPRTLFSGLLPVGVSSSVYFCLLFSITLPSHLAKRGSKKVRTTACRVVFYIFTFAWFVAVPRTFLWTREFGLGIAVALVLPLAIYLAVYCSYVLFLAFDRRQCLTN